MKIPEQTKARLDAALSQWLHDETMAGRADWALEEAKREAKAASERLKEDVDKVREFQAALYLRDGVPCYLKVNDKIIRLCVEGGALSIEVVRLEEEVQ